MSQTYPEKIIREKTLFLCMNDACEQYFALFVADDEKKQDCPKSAAHGPMVVVSADSEYGGWNTCGTKDCKYHLSMVVPTDQKNRCLGCKKNPVKVSALDLKALQAYEPPRKAGDMPHALNALEKQVKAAEDWKTSHHSKTTSKGTVKTGTSQAWERDSQADRADTTQGNTRARFLNDALDAAIRWKLRAEENGELTKKEGQHYRELAGRAKTQIEQYGGRAVTEDDVANEDD